MAVDEHFLDILICPRCYGEIHFNEKQDGLICDKCQLLYEIKNDIPNLLIQEAKDLRKK